MDIVISGAIQKELNKTYIVHKVLRPGYKLYVGSHCNDGRPITESWKYKQALKNGNPIIRVGQHKPKVMEQEQEQEQKSHKKELLVDKYRPKTISDVIGHKNEIQQITTWLQSWENSFPTERGILVTGPPGIGKTTTLHLIAQSLGYKVTEYNASDTRSVSILKGMIALGMKRLQKEVIIMDEIDGLSERGGVGEIAAIIRKTNVPILCIANEKPPKLKPIIGACLDLRFSRPVRSTIATALMKVAKQENIEINKIELETLCEKNGNDIRSILTRLEFYGSGTMKADADKDSTLRLDLFSATQKLIGNKKLTWDQASDLVFVDYHMVPLMVQEAYIASSKKSLDDIVSASDLLSSGDMMNKKLYKTQDWSLLPLVVNTTVSVARTVSGPAPFQIFPQLLGKNSKRAKHQRLMDDMAKRTGHSSSTMRLDYAEPMRYIFTSGLKTDKPDIKGTIQRMDSVKLTRDDLMDTLEQVGFKEIDIPTKVKTAFTREWNKCHETEKNISAKKRKQIESDNEEEEEEEDDVDELEKELLAFELDD
jgi:replication factor C subunit 1